MNSHNAEHQPQYWWYIYRVLYMITSTPTILMPVFLINSAATGDWRYIVINVSKRRIKFKLKSACYNVDEGRIIVMCTRRNVTRASLTIGVGRRGVFCVSISSPSCWYTNIMVHWTYHQCNYVEHTSVPFQNMFICVILGRTTCSSHDYHLRLRCVLIEPLKVTRIYRQCWVISHISLQLQKCIVFSLGILRCYECIQ